MPSLSSAVGRSDTAKRKQVQQRTFSFCYFANVIVYCSVQVLLLSLLVLAINIFLHRVGAKRVAAVTPHTTASNLHLSDSSRTRPLRLGDPLAGVRENGCCRRNSLTCGLFLCHIKQAAPPFFALPRSLVESSVFTVFSPSFQRVSRLVTVPSKHELHPCTPQGDPPRDLDHRRRIRPLPRHVEAYVFCALLPLGES